MRILVTGASGTVGGSVAARLAGTEHAVRALVRDPSRYEAPASVEVVEGDLTVADDIRRALDGVDRAFLNMADDNGTVFAPLAGDTGLDHVVLLSSFSAVTPLKLGDANIITARHRAGERVLSVAGVPATFLRAAGFAYNVLMWTSAIRDGVVRSPYPDVKLPIVDPADIAAVAAAVLVDEAPVGGPLSITGPELVSVRDQTAILAEVLRRGLRLEQWAEADAKAATFPEGTPSFVVDSIFGTFDEQAAVLAVSDDVERVLGRPPRTFADWVRDHIAAFR